MFKTSIRLITAVVALSILVAPSAFASDAGSNDVMTASLETVSDAGVLWIAADVEGETAETVAIDIMAPGRKGKILWQRCKLPFSGAGRYVCGIDVSEGSLASKRTGTWVAKIKFDGGTVASRIRFQV